MIVNRIYPQRQIRVCYSTLTYDGTNYAQAYGLDIPLSFMAGGSDSTVSSKAFVDDEVCWLRFDFQDDSPEALANGTSMTPCGWKRRKGLLWHAKFGGLVEVDADTKTRVIYDYPGLTSRDEVDFMDWLRYWFPNKELSYQSMDIINPLRFNDDYTVVKKSLTTLRLKRPASGRSTYVPLLWNSPEGVCYSVLQINNRAAYMGVYHFVDPRFSFDARNQVYVTGKQYSFGNSGPLHSEIEGSEVIITTLDLIEAFNSATTAYPSTVMTSRSLERFGQRNLFLSSYYVATMTHEKAVTSIRKFKYGLCAFASTYSRIVARPNHASTPTVINDFPKPGNFEYDLALQSALYGAMEGSKQYPGIEYTTSNSWQNVLAMVGVAASWVGSGRLDLPEAWKDTWLQYRYVGSTGISDLTAYCDYVSKRVQRFYNPWILHRGFAEFNGYPISVSFASRDRVTSGWANVVKTAQAWGFYPSWYQLWDFVPYSFIVDWALPIGPQLEHMQKAGYYTSRNFEFSHGYWITTRGTKVIEGSKVSFFMRDYCTDYTIDDYAFQDVYSPSTKVKIKRSIDTIALGKNLKNLANPTQLLQEVREIGEKFSRYGY